MWVIGSWHSSSRRLRLPSSVCRENRRLRHSRRLVAVRLRDGIGSGRRFSRFANARWRGARLEAITFVVLFAVTGFTFARLLSGGANDDDDLALRFKDASGPFAVAVFAPSGDLAAGPSPFAVLVQDRNTEEVLLDTTVDLSARPSVDLQGQSSTGRASHDDSDNKLLQSTEVDLPAAGDWTLQIAVRRDSQAADFSWPLSVVKAGTGFEFPWPYFGVLLFAAMLLIAYFRRHRAPTMHDLTMTTPPVAHKGNAGTGIGYN